jgi:hypothetical protein
VARRIEKLTRRVIYSVPSPSPWDVVEKEVRAIREEYKKLTGES